MLPTSTHIVRYPLFFLLDPSPQTPYDPAMRRDSPLDSLASVLAGLAHRLGLESKLLEIPSPPTVERDCRPASAAHTRPDQIRFKKLYVYVQHSVGQHHHLKPNLLDKINAAAGESLVSDLVLRIGDFGPDSSKV